MVYYISQVCRKKIPFLGVTSIAVIFWLTSCSQHGTGITNRAYHNLTAHYNAYFLANEKIAEADKALFINRKDDYTRLLDVLIPMDSVQAGAVKAQAEYAIQKASIAIGRHKHSKWKDDSYLLIARARHLQVDFPNAIETYKYVNTESQSDAAKHQALIGLLRVFTDAKDYSYARASIEILRKEKLSKKELVEFYLARAQYHRQLEEYDPMLAILKQTAKRMPRGERKARVHFIIAQLYQQLNKEPDAYKNYLATLRNNPSYELAFYAQLNLIQVFQTKNAQDNKRLMAYFRKLLRDQKNVDYKDKIYYQMALYEYKQAHYPQAIDYLQQSVKANTNDPAQKGYAFLKLGEIYYEKLQQYDLAKAFYDSTMLVLPKTTPNYEAVAKRHKVLDSFVEQITTIRTEDSLQRLSKMDAASREQYFDKLLDEEERKEKELEERRSQETAQAAGSIFDTGTDDKGRSNGGGNNNTGGSNGKWYFSNTTALAQGRTAFTRRWGNRPLEDNWRRVNKEREADFRENSFAAVKRNAPQPVADPKAERKKKKETMLAAVPSSPEALAASDKKVEDAYFKLGKIYDLELQETKNAIHTYDTLLVRYPESDYEPEVYYSLYLIHQKQGNPEQETYRNKLIAEHPTSSFAKLVQNPNYLREEGVAGLQGDRAFAEVYQQFEFGNYAEADRLITDGLQHYGNNPIAEKFQVLRIRIIGKTQNVNAYRNALAEFLTQHPDSKLLPYVQNLLKATDGFANRK